MMVGGGMMLFFGLLFMLLVIGLPVLLIGAIVAGVWKVSNRNNGQASTSPGHSDAGPSSAPFTRYCSHCGQGLQPDWTHCPNCGAPI